MISVAASSSGGLLGYFYSNAKVADKLALYDKYINRLRECPPPTPEPPEMSSVVPSDDILVISEAELLAAFQNAEITEAPKVVSSAQLDAENAAKKERSKLTKQLLSGEIKELPAGTSQKTTAMVQGNVKECYGYECYLREGIDCEWRQCQFSRDYETPGGIIISFMGSLDGLNDTDVLEIKTRQFRILENIPANEWTQIKIYMWMTGRRSCKFMQTCGTTHQMRTLTATDEELEKTVADIATLVDKLYKHAHSEQYETYMKDPERKKWNYLKKIIA